MTWIALDIGDKGLAGDRMSEECAKVCIGGVCGLTLHGLSCLDELGHTRRHMLGVHGQLLLLLRHGLLQHLRTQTHAHAHKKPTGCT